MELDQFDRQLLNLVREDAGQTAERLAEQISLSASAIQRRLRVLVITAPDTETYDPLMSRMVGENPNVKRFTTNVALSVVKRGLTIPIPMLSGTD